jgi:YHS domain-containing protein
MEVLMKNRKTLTLFLAISFVFILGGIAQQKAGDTAVDPVCGMTVKKAEAKATYEYKGETYYFCNTGCKDAFAKDPEKYLQKEEGTKAVYTCPMHPEVQASEPGKCPKCGMNLVKKDMSKGPMMTHGLGMAGGMHGQMMAGGQSCGMNCPLRSADVEMTMENLPDGVAVKFTSKNPETVKAIQEHLASGKGCGMMGMECCRKAEKE